MDHGISLQCIVGDRDDPAEEHVQESRLIWDWKSHLSTACRSDKYILPTQVTNLLVKGDDRCCEERQEVFLQQGRLHLHNASISTG